MEQTAGPIDRRTGKAIPVPGHSMKMSSMLARLIGCAIVSRSLPSPPFTPSYKTAFDSSASIDPRAGPPYTCLSQAYLMNTYYPQIVGSQAEMTPPFSHNSRTSSCSTISATFLPEAVQPCLQGQRLPRTPFISQLASTSGPASAPNSSGTSAAYRRPSSARSNQYNSDSPTTHISECNKIKVHNFNSEGSVELLRHFLEDTQRLSIVQLRLSKGKGPKSRVFITFLSDRDAEIAVQKLNGFVVSGSKLSASLDIYRHRNCSVANGKRSNGVTQRWVPPKMMGTGKSSTTSTAKVDTSVRPGRRGPVIIDGSQD